MKRVVVAAVLFLVCAIAVAQAPQIAGRITTSNVMDEEVTLKFTEANSYAHLNLEDGTKTHSLILGAEVAIPPDCPVIAVAQHAEATEVVDLEGADLLSSLNGDSQASARVYQSAIRDPLPTEERVSAPTTLYLHDLPLVPSMLQRVGGLVGILVAAHMETRTIAAKAGNSFIPIAGGYEIQLTRVARQDDETVVEASLLRPDIESSLDPFAAPMLHPNKVVLIDDQGQEYGSRSPTCGSPIDPRAGGNGIFEFQTAASR